MIDVKDCKSVWNNCLQYIGQCVGEQSFKTWFEPIEPLMLINNVLTIQVPSQFFYEWLEEHYVHVLRKAIDLYLGPDGRLEYQILVDKSDQNRKNTMHSLHKGSIISRSVNPGQHRDEMYAKSVDTTILDSTLNPHYTFDTFIEGDCNKLARSAGMAVSNKPGLTSFNPLLVYGGVGLGKTHLVQAIGNQIRKQSSDKKVLYVPSERFINQFIEAMKNNNAQDFTNHYLGVDVLILDDVQFLSGKEKTQEIFFQIFNHLHQSGKQIIITSDCAPKDIKGLQERLLSRFKWGLSADLQVPDYETRNAIIRKKMQFEGIELGEDVIDYLAYSIDTNMRDLEGVVNSLIAQYTLSGRKIDLELAKSIIQNIVQNVDTEVNIDYIQKFVSEYFSVTIEQMKDKTRKREIVIARQVAMYFAKEYTNMSLKSIGSHFGGRDHSTVIHALTSVSDLMDTDKKFRATMQDLIKKIKLKSS
ncbi:MAG: chromosomal replication initiator protein DnaA [Cytophagaceae bacterium]|jgi:chromosomal replication initiator protein|nr:chromosomal replication initiator protein DnaA [Cytophagaceae bacterium]